MRASSDSSTSWEQNSFVEDDDAIPNLKQDDSFKSLPEGRQNNYKAADNNMFNIEENENETTNNFAIVDLKRSPTKTKQC